MAQWRRRRAHGHPANISRRLAQCFAGSFSVIMPDATMIHRQTVIGRCIERDQLRI